MPRNNPSSLLRFLDRPYRPEMVVVPGKRRVRRSIERRTLQPVRGQRDPASRAEEYTRCPQGGGSYC